MFVQLSSNIKCGCSVNLPRSTCRPSRDCRRYCYAKRGPIAFANSTRLQQQNLDALTRATDLDALADDLYYQVKAKRGDFLRWNGSGDLTIEAVRTINTLAKRHPDLKLWIASRKPDLAAKLDNLPNIYIMLSVDKSTTRTILSGMRKLCAQASDRIYLSYMQSDENDLPPDDIRVIFAYHCGAMRAKWATAEKDNRYCPNTLANKKEDANCANCRRCFSTLARKK